MLTIEDLWVELKGLEICESWKIRRGDSWKMTGAFEKDLLVTLECKRYVSNLIVNLDRPRMGSLENQMQSVSSF